MMSSRVELRSPTITSRAILSPSSACGGGLGRGRLQRVSTGDLAPSLPRKRGRGKKLPPARMNRILPRNSPRRERLAERFAHVGTMQARVITLLRATRRYLEIDENRPRLRQQGADLLLENLQVGEF